MDKPIEALEEKIDSSQTGVDLDGGVAEKEGILDESKKDKKEEKKTKEK